MRKTTLLVLALLAIAASLRICTPASAKLTGAIWTTNQNCAEVNGNIYEKIEDVYLNGGPRNRNSPGLPSDPCDCYYFQVTDPSGKVLLSSDDISKRKFWVKDGRIYGLCQGTHNVTLCANNTIGVQLAPFIKTPNPGGEYKVWVTQTCNYKPGEGNFGFIESDCKTDNFKVRRNPPCCEIITGCKWYDTDGDGCWDTDEEPLKDYPIYLTDAQGNVVQQTVTGTNGAYGFEVSCGDYYVTEGKFDCWEQTFPGPNHDPAYKYWIPNPGPSTDGKCTWICKKDFGNVKKIEKIFCFTKVPKCLKEMPGETLFAEFQIVNCKDPVIDPTKWCKVPIDQCIPEDIAGLAVPKPVDCFLTCCSKPIKFNEGQCIAFRFGCEGGPVVWKCDPWIETIDGDGKCLMKNVKEFPKILKKFVVKLKCPPEKVKVFACFACGGGVDGAPAVLPTDDSFKCIELKPCPEDPNKYVGEAWLPAGEFIFFCKVLDCYDKEIKRTKCEKEILTPCKPVVVNECEIKFPIKKFFCIKDIPCTIWGCENEKFYVEYQKVNCENPEIKPDCWQKIPLESLEQQPPDSIAWSCKTACSEKPIWVDEGECIAYRWGFYGEADWVSEPKVEKICDEDNDCKIINIIKFPKIKKCFEFDIHAAPEGIKAFACYRFKNGCKTEWQCVELERCLDIKSRFKKCIELPVGVLEFYLKIKDCNGNDLKVCCSGCEFLSPGKLIVINKCEFTFCCPRSKGYWTNWMNHYDLATMQKIVGEVNSDVNGFSTNCFTSGLLGDYGIWKLVPGVKLNQTTDTIGVAYYLGKVQNASPMNQALRAQLLACELNVAVIQQQIPCNESPLTGACPNTPVYLCKAPGYSAGCFPAPVMTVKELIEYCESHVGYDANNPWPTWSDQKIAAYKDAFEAINTFCESSLKILDP